MDCAVVLFTRDLRLHDHPALAGALGDADLVVPLFVLDDTLTKQSANRTAFLLECLRDLDSRLRDRGGALVIARGDPVAETMRIAGEHGASAVYLSSDVTPHGRRRDEQLDAACRTQRLALHRCPGVTAIPADLLHPAGQRPLPRVHAVLEGMAACAAPRRALGTATDPRSEGAGAGTPAGAS